MRQSELFTETGRSFPKDETFVSAQLLIRAGFVEKLMAGAYSFLPLGLRVLKNIENIVREEMDAIGGQEILMPMLHPKNIWQKTGGWDKIDILFKLKSRNGKEYALGQSEEEVVTPLAMKRVRLYRDLPLAVYQIHWKFRDELRAKSGLLRGIEFSMKDMYSFHENQEDFERFYDIVKRAYLRVFERMGLVVKVSEASGGAFTEKISYEFMVLTEAGEDRILSCNGCDFCVNVQIAEQKEGSRCPRCRKGKLERATASEVGNVFDLGQKYAKDFNLAFLDRNNEKQYPVMGCYGIGISRLMGVVVETSHDERGIIWPPSIAPFRAHLLEIGGASAEALYESLQKQGIAVLYDDRKASAGEKFADADLIGIPIRLLVSPKTDAKVEVKKRNEMRTTLLSRQDVVKALSGTAADRQLY